MRQYPSSAALTRAAEAAKVRETETANVLAARDKVVDAKSSAILAEGDLRAAEAREEVAARVVNLHLSEAIPPNEPPVVAGSPRGPAGPVIPPASRTWFWNDGSPSAAGWLAVVLAIVAIILALLALLGKDSMSEKKVTDLVTSNVTSSLAPIAKIANEAKETANKAAADASQAKADAANAVTTANDAKAAAAACTERCRPAAPKPAAKPQRKRAPAGTAHVPPPREEAKLPPPPPVGRFWGWVHPEATAANKRTCYADRKIIGMPEQCSSVELFPREGNESEVRWNARVAAKNGIAPGVKTDKGVIKGIEFGRVEVK